MIIVGDVPVLPHSFGPSLYTKKGFSFYQELAQKVHAHGCKLCAQLHQSDTRFGGMWKYLPGLVTGTITRDQLRQKVNDATGPYITSLPREKVEEITLAFGQAARLAVQAGFDIVQVHGDRMCGSFSSSLFNHRTDEYGGSPENRARFAVEAVSSIRRVLPDLPIDYKLAIRQENPGYGRAGVLEEELPVFVSLLEEAGVTSFHITLANHGKLTDTIPPRDHPEFGAEGCFLKFCDQVRPLTRLPLCGVGGLTSPDFAEEQLKQGRMDCAGLSRPLLADSQWPKKTAAGQVGEIRPCLRCNQCLSGMMAHQGVHCIYERKEFK